LLGWIVQKLQLRLVACRQGQPCSSRRQLRRLVLSTQLFGKSTWILVRWRFVEGRGRSQKIWGRCGAVSSH